MAIEVLQTNPDITDKALAELLSLKRLTRARFWRLEAVEILNASLNQDAPDTGLTPIVKEA